MIAAANPPAPCANCGTPRPTCVDRREYRSAACCERCDHDDRPRCAGCGAGGAVDRDVAQHVQRRSVGVRRSDAEL